METKRTPIEMRHAFLLSMGFEEIPSGKVFKEQIYSHKMFLDTYFRFSDVDPDTMWTMERIFSTCIAAGEKKRADAISKLLS